MLTDQVAWLRDQLKEKDDRLLALASPSALAQVSGKPLGGAAQHQAEATLTDREGNLWVNVNGRAIPLQVYQQLMAGAAHVDPEGRVVPESEWAEVQDHIERAVNGSH